MMEGAKSFLASPSVSCHTTIARFAVGKKNLEWEKEILGVRSVFLSLSLSFLLHLCILLSPFSFFLSLPLPTFSLSDPTTYFVHFYTTILLSCSWFFAPSLVNAGRTYFYISSFLYICHSLSLSISVSLSLCMYGLPHFTSLKPLSNSN